MIMYILMSLAVLFFAAGLTAATRSVAGKRVSLAEADLAQTKASYQDDHLRKQGIDKEKKELEEKAAQIFTLYDVTREITKNFSEQDALNAFREKLRENVFFEDCLLLEPLAGEARDLRNDPAYLLFMLRGKNRLLGYLAVKGVRDGDKDKVTILANQFALALQRIRLYQEVERLAMTDSLTEIFTRRYILERFEEELQRSRSRNTSLSLLMVDVDHFKRFNDQHGHLTGDQILRGIARTIRESIREIDIVGRFGGEEFCVVLPDTNREGASYVAERIRAAVEKAQIKAYDTLARTTVSIGSATFPDDGVVASEVLDKADWALYRAKNKGRNTTCAFGVY